MRPRLRRSLAPLTVPLFLAIQRLARAQAGSTQGVDASSPRQPSTEATPEAATKSPDALPEGSPKEGAPPSPQLAANPPAEPDPAPLAPPPSTAVTVSGRPREGQRLQRSAEAVTVVDTRKAREQAADLGEVLARTQGVAVRRDGGLGSGARISLNGLYDDQIRFFVDGVPLDVSGFPFGVSSVPVNLVERVEVYRGVVPVRFGADALGGAINVVTDPRYRTGAAASYQTGSYGTYRFTANGGYRDEGTGLVARGAFFFDRARNDYPVDVEVSDPRGRYTDVTVPRFHDRYHAAGGSLEAGVVDRPWARRLTLQGFAASYGKQLQNNLVMTTPYGEATYGETVYGLTGRYEAKLAPRVDLEVLANYAHRTIDFSDQSSWVYDWFGHRVRALSTVGEVGTPGTDQTSRQDAAFGRALATFALGGSHVLRASVSPRVTTRKGVQRLTLPSAVDLLGGEQNLVTLVSGLEYEVGLFGDRLSNVVFVKDYVYSAKTDQPVVDGSIVRHDVGHHAAGVGDSLRVRFTPWLYAKASYEYATRLPRADEVFGDGVLVRSSLELTPEVSHNANLGPRVELRGTEVGEITLDLNGFLRDSDHLIVLLPEDQAHASYQNVNRARGVGLEGAAAWTSRGRLLHLDGSFTWQDVRNVSGEGSFGKFDGDRIPNAPYGFGSLGARLSFADAPGPSDAVEPFYYARYVHSFFRGWESQGLRAYKQVVDAQVTHDVGVSWIVQREGVRVTSTFEIDNLTDAKVFDNFGVQKPGRAAYVKVTGEFF